MKANIMLIDDDYSTNFYHQIILEEAQVAKDLTLCKSVDNAMEALNNMSNAPDIIFLDTNMPCKDGWDFLREYRTLDEKKKAKIIIMLSSSKPPCNIETNKDFELIHDFKVKPIEVDKVSSLIDELALM